MRIGIPRALLYYYYFPLWKTLFEELGHTVVVSDATTKEILDKGIKLSVPEICVPIKIFNGHVIDLIEKEVDYIFIPRMVSIEKGMTFCPKFLGLPDMVKFTFKELEGKMISPKINTSSEKAVDFNNYKSIAGILGVSDKDLKKALRAAQKKWLEFRALSKQGYLLNEITESSVDGLAVTAHKPQKTEITIGLIGYVYNIYDEFVSMNIAAKLQELGAKVITFEMLDEEIISNEIKRMRKALFWTFSNKILGAGYYFYKNSQIDGLIHVTAFGCGPDSFLGKLLELDSEQYSKPFMTIRVDEHTGENHLQTRIEAFVDMLKKKKKKREIQ
jgi:predicted nucleotide-binding protein (sugar kinase/HSP70/actin superfamily)